MIGPPSGHSAFGTLLTGVTVTGAGNAVEFKSSIPWRVVQATVAGTGAVTATVNVEVSNDKANWVLAGTISLSGTTSATDGFAMQAPWIFVRGDVTAISGTGAAVTLLQSV